MKTNHKQIAASLRRHLDPPASFEIPARSGAAAWLAALGIGSPSGKVIRVSRPEAERARIMLLHELEAHSFAFLDSDHDSRAQTLDDSRNEKLAGAKPRARRCAVKAFPGMPLATANNLYMLPASFHIEINHDSIADFDVHSCIVAVENWENFEKLPPLSSNLCDSLPAGSNPLAIWRGSPEISTGAAVKAIESFGKPCFAFVDFDPAGLVIAASLPHFSGFFAPPEAELEALFFEHKRDKLYAQQNLPDLFEGAPSNWKLTRRLCEKYGAGAPQEHYAK